MQHSLVLGQHPARRAIVSAALLFLTALMLFAALWYIDIYGNIGCDAMLFTLAVGTKGVQKGLIGSFTVRGALPAFFVAGALFAALFLPRRLPLLLRRALLALLCLSMAGTAISLVELPQFLLGLLNTTPLLAREYRDPRDTEITFPAQKRNLIYLFMESMETTFMDKSQGGCLDGCRIPELYALAAENVNFSPTDEVGGARTLRGGTWTMGAMMTQTAALPMRLSLPDTTDTNLPGAVTLQDILHDNGYYQVLMVGSDAEYGNRADYYRQHQTDEILDLYTAQAAGIVPEDYWVWWGMEDERLYAYARQELLRLSEQDAPFALTLLTADTHHVDGYVCPLCEDTYSEQYENVYACASHQAAAFIRWLQGQDFYENTTIVIVGDHLSMDHGYFTYNGIPQRARYVYNCFINPAVQPVRAKHRSFATVDMMPTTLAALGCTVSGDRLGLGVNLFSDTPTLIERLGLNYINNELLKRTDEYNAFLE